MSRGNVSAQDYIVKAMKREKSVSRVSNFYGISPLHVALYLEGRDCGPLTARKVIRVEIARKQAEKEGRVNFWPTDKDRYKGTRNY